MGGDLVGNARWTGVPLADLLDEAGVDRSGTQVVGRSVDGWTCGFPTEIALDGRDALIAVGMNGESLPIVHGFPARLVVPGLYGYVCATKWLTEIEITGVGRLRPLLDPAGVGQGGPIKTQSRIDVPRGARPSTAGHDGGGRRGLGAAPGHLDGRGPCRRRSLAGGRVSPTTAASTPGASG